ncbi:hypothetical protein [Bradyrhizobium sp. USDA 4518]
MVSAIAICGRFDFTGLAIVTTDEAGMTVIESAPPALIDSSQSRPKSAENALVFAVFIDPAVFRVDHALPF